MSGGPEEQGAGTVEMPFLDLIISACHQSVNPSVPGPAVEGVEVLPVAKGSAQRGARVASIVLCKLTFPIGHKSCKFLGISCFKGLKFESQEVMIFNQVETPKFQALMRITGRKTAKVAPVSDLLPLIYYARTYTPCALKDNV